MPSKKQVYTNHTSWFPVWHFVAFPITWVYAFWAIWLAIRVPGLTEIVHAVWALAVALAVYASRAMVLVVQNRVIRLEMRLRLREVLPAPLAARIRELTVRQLIGLRFASDAELPSLVERVLKGELAGQKQIKQAITDWQGDHLRA